MQRRLIITFIFTLLLAQADLFSQGRSAFTGDPSKFGTELRSFMGPNLNEQQKTNLELFLVKWDSAAYNAKNQANIIDAASQLSSRFMRPVPHFDVFITALNFFTEFKRDEASFERWITGLSELAFSPRYTNDQIYMFLKNSTSMLRENILYQSGTVTWKVKNNEIRFLHDTVFYISLTNATLVCISQQDSTEIQNVTGAYYPEFQLFKGKTGLVTWEKVGYARNNVFAEIFDFSINTSRSSFTADSALFFHSSYFKKPVSGTLTDQTSGSAGREKSAYPRFVTDTAKFLIKSLYKDIDYEGGLTFEGQNVKGTGTKYIPAMLYLYRRDTLYLKLSSQEYMFSGRGINSQETAMTMYLEDDSIYHGNLGFSYLSEPRQVNLFRTSNPLSVSPYFNTYHDYDMYFEYMIWNMDEARVSMSRARGAAAGQARFESSSFFVDEYYSRLMGFDNFHPLVRLVRFSEWFYSETFPVPDFAKWLNRPVDYVTGLCIDLANRGFVFFDRLNNEVTIKQKTKDFIAFSGKKKDYDIISVLSETKAPVENAYLDLNTREITVNGVRSVFLSDSQMVAIYPYNQQIRLGKNRDFRFAGVVVAGLFTLYGRDFNFSYDTFKLRLEKIDSLRVAVETDERDRNGRPIVKDVDNIMQLGRADIFIDRPDNKSGLLSLKQYPIIDSKTYSYIFYDSIRGLEGVYPRKDFYFRIDPYTYENIDHYSYEDMNLRGEFFGGNILKPSEQMLIIEQNNSLGFNMTVPAQGVELYDNRAVLYENISMSSKGLIGSGRLTYLTSETRAGEFRFFPDSMLTHASTFRINPDPAGVFPALTADNVDIKWNTAANEWHAANTRGKNFQMFNNGTVLNGTITMSPGRIRGTGIIDMSESRITSNSFNFASNAVRADTADYFIRARNTSGYSFIAENARTDINFDRQLATFRLNTDSSMVVFPEIQYFSTMTNFSFNMTNRVLEMEQPGRAGRSMMNPADLLKVNRNNLEKPTFYATNNISDTLAFAALRASYHLDKEYILAENIKYIPVADALIQPPEGMITITRRARIQPMEKAVIAVNNKHIIRDAKVDIENTKRFSGSGVYDYVDENNDIQQIAFHEIAVDTLTTHAAANIPVSQKFMLSQAFSFNGDVRLNARDEFLTFTGSTGIINTCYGIKSYNIRFKGQIDPANIFIPVTEKVRDSNDNMVFSGTFFNADSLLFYPAFLSEKKSYSDIPLVNASGFLYYDKARSTYLISSREKIANRTLPGNLVALDRNFCIMSSEGKLDLGAKYDLVNFVSAGKVRHVPDSGKVMIEAIMGLDFHFSNEALAMIADELRLVPSLKPVNINSELNNKGMRDLFGDASAGRIKEEMSLFGMSRNLPREFNYEIFLNDVKLFWNPSSSSYRSTGKIGIGFIGNQPVNLYVDGFVEIQRRRTGDMIDIYLKANTGTWYYFSYFKGVMMTQSANTAYNKLIADTKANSRKHPDSSTRLTYSYMIAVEDRLPRFLRRMESDTPADDGTSFR
jgi:hypothetical protein